MKDRLKRIEQYAVPTIQTLERDMSEYDNSFPKAYQNWMCPNCDTHHLKQPYEIEQYECNCGWHGDRNELLRSDLSCLTTT